MFFELQQERVCYYKAVQTRTSTRRPFLTHDCLRLTMARIVTTRLICHLAVKVNPCKCPLLGFCGFYKSRCREVVLGTSEDAPR